MNKQDIIRQIAAKSNLSQDQVKQILNELINVIAQTLARGDRISIAGFGNFILSNRKERLGINPQNPQQRVQIPKSQVPFFRPGAKLKQRFNQQNNQTNNF